MIIGGLGEKEVIYLRIAALTTALTAAFIPAESPPEVSTAIFISGEWMGVFRKSLGRVPCAFRQESNHCSGRYTDTLVLRL